MPTPPAKSREPLPKHIKPPKSGLDVGSPTDLARETLSRLAQHKVPPTPENYRKIYFEIRGSADEDVFPDHALKAIVEALPRDTPAMLHHAQAFERAVAQHQWNALKAAIIALHNTLGNNDSKAWDELIHKLFVQFERLHGDLTQARKREALNRVLDAHPSSDILFERLSALVRGWSQTNKSADGTTPATDTPDSESAASVAQHHSLEAIVAASDFPLRPVFARILSEGVVSLGGGDAALEADAKSLAEAIIFTRDAPELLGQLETLIGRMTWIGEEHNAMRQALLELLRLIVDNIRSLVIDDQWLHGQLSMISRTFSGPLSLRMLDDVGQQLRDVIDKQGTLKADLAKAQTRLKEMLAGFVNRLSEVTVSTSDYHQVLSRGVTRINEASSLSELSDVVGELLAGTQLAQESARRAKTELIELRGGVDDANQRIVRLQQELETASKLVRIDPLTGALNRKGLAEEMTREVSRMRRSGKPLCIALIDIDNFKRLNDTYGHAIGDEALRHLTETIKKTVRPQDVVARYGGEEFVILLPDTPVDAAESALERLQRQLTRSIFCAANSERVLITFSAGIALLGDREEPEAAITRADEAMYCAKRAGKNRVLLAM